MGSIEKTHRAHPFTLSELLVSLAIVFILLSLLLPALKNAMEGSKNAVCQNRLKQIAFASFHYSDDSFGQLPKVLNPDTGANDSRAFFKHLIGVYLGFTPDKDFIDLPGGYANLPKTRRLNQAYPNPSYARAINKNIGAFDCPSQDTYRLQATGPTLNEKWTEYGINIRIIDGIKFKDLHPEQIFIQDGGEAYNHFAWYVHVKLVHFGKANFLFSDGRIEHTDVYKYMTNLNQPPWSGF